jgi:hypothetical protein
MTWFEKCYSFYKGKWFGSKILDLLKIYCKQGEKVVNLEGKIRAWDGGHFLVRKSIT